MRRRQPEAEIQRAVVDLLRKAGCRGIFFAVPNGGKRPRIEAAIMQSLGVRAGVPDLAGSLPGGKSWFLEIKAPSGRLSQEQLAFGNECLTYGIPWAVASSLEEAVHHLKAWGVFAREVRL